MGVPAAKKGDQVMGVDTHIILIPPNAAPTPVPHPFSGILDGELSTDVNITGLPAATQGSKASNQPPHIPQGGPFQKPPANTAEVIMGSSTVFVNGKAMARMGDTAKTCNDPADLPAGTVVASGTVLVG